MINWLEEAIQLEATPKHARQETVQEFCARHALPVSNYYYHVSKQENKAKVLEITLNKAKDEAPEVLEVLVNKAKEGDMRAMDIYVDSILKLAKNLDLSSGGKPIFIPSEIAQKNNIQIHEENA